MPFSYSINFKKLSSNICLPKDIINDDFKNIDPVFLKVILLIFSNTEKHFSTNLISNLLNVSEEKVIDAISYWCSKNILCHTGKGTNSPAEKVHKIKYNSVKAEKAVVSASDNQELIFLIQCIEQQIKRPISPAEYRVISDILTFTDLPADVILMAAEHCITLKKFTPQYFKTICTTWAKKGIITHELAEKYLSDYAKNKSYENDIKHLFGIERNFSDYEKNFINHWLNDLPFDLSCIKLAFERTIERINKISFPYINKILETWYDKGFSSIDDINSENNTISYSDTKSYDIDELEHYWDTVPKLK